MQRRVALITGVTGQDGQYLAAWLQQQDYEVHGIVALADGDCPANVTPHSCDLSDGSNLSAILNDVAPDEVYNLAAQSDVQLSFELPVYTADVTGVGALRVLEAVREHCQQRGRAVRFCQASSSDMFGEPADSPQNESTPLRPLTPYACAKAFAHWQTVNYRRAFGLFACSAILFNHESPRRAERFVTRKITRAAGRIKVGSQQKLKLGNVAARRDWGFAGDYVRAMWLMLQQETPDDYVIATGKTHSVSDFLEEVFGFLGLDWREHIETDKRFYRPVDVDCLCGDAGKAERVLGWTPTMSFQELARTMTAADLELARREKHEQNG